MIRVVRGICYIVIVRIVRVFEGVFRASLGGNFDWGCCFIYYGFIFLFLDYYIIRSIRCFCNLGYHFYYLCRIFHIKRRVMIPLLFHVFLNQVRILLRNDMIRNLMNEGYLLPIISSIISS